MSDERTRLPFSGHLMLFLHLCCGLTDGVHISVNWFKFDLLEAAGQPSSPTDNYQTSA